MTLETKSLHDCFRQEQLVGRALARVTRHSDEFVQDTGVHILDDLIRNVYRPFHVDEEVLYDAKQRTLAVLSPMWTRRCLVIQFNANIRVESYIKRVRIIIATISERDRELMEWLSGVRKELDEISRVASITRAKKLFESTRERLENERIFLSRLHRRHV